MATYTDNKISGYATLSIRFVQGWIFWGGGSRRFIYDPEKLDPYASVWMANKFQSAMPGAILGMSNIISFMVQHFYLLYISIILFSLVELIAGLALMTGFCTRLAGLTTALISIVLMLAFGWQGATCMDEWTMAVATLAMGLTLAISGAPIFSLDNLLLAQHPSLTRKKWFTAFCSGPLSTTNLQRISIGFLTFVVVFTLFTYNYYRGAIFTPYHEGPVSATVHHITLDHASFTKDNMLAFTAYVDAGTPALPANIIRIDLINDKGEVAEEWNGSALSALASANIHNEYDYNKITTGPYGLVAPMSARATVTLPLANKHLSLLTRKYKLQLYTINGHRFELAVK